MTYYYEQYNGSGDRIHFDIFYRRAYWKRRFLWTPKQCNLTGKRLWLQYAEEGVAMYTGPGDPVFEFRYHHPKHHILWLLARDYK